MVLLHLFSGIKPDRSNFKIIKTTFIVLKTILGFRMIQYLYHFLNHRITL